MLWVILIEGILYHEKFLISCNMICRAAKPPKQQFHIVSFLCPFCATCIPLFSRLLSWLLMQAFPLSFFLFLPQAIHISILSLCLHLSFYPTSFWGAGVDSKLAYCTRLQCSCTVLERTREAKIGPLHHPHQGWLGSGRGSMHRLWGVGLAWPICL